MKPGTQHHFKISRLMKALGIERFAAVGIVNMIWALAAEQCEDGNLGRLTNVEIAEYLDWREDPDALIAALLAKGPSGDAGWLDPAPGGRFVIHDWLVAGPRYVRERASRKSKAAAEHEAAEIAADPRPLIDPAPRPLIDRLEGVPAKPAKPPKKKTYPADFERWFAIYPRKNDKKPAAAEYQRALIAIMAERGCERPAAVDWLLERVKAYARSPQAAVPTFCKFAVRWLSKGCYNETEADWQVSSGNGQAPAPIHENKPIVKTFTPVKIGGGGSIKKEAG